MTLEELHSRILLHELRAILFDDSRGGTPVPAGYRELIEGSPHESTNYLVLADHFDDEGDVLGELIRIQVELIGLLPNYLQHLSHYKRGDIHPFEVDLWAWRHPLTERRWELITPLYEQHNDMGRPDRTSRLGRTTRMLTDVIRWCFMNHGKNVLIIHNDPVSARGHLCGLAYHLIAGDVEDITPYMGVVTIFGNYIDATNRTASHHPDVTFTDHAYTPQEPLTVRPDQHAIWQQQALDAEIRRVRMLQLMQFGGRIEYNPSAFIKPDNT